MSECIRFHDYPVCGIDPMTASTARSFPRHVHDQYGIGVVDSGAHASWSDRGQVEAGPGDLICVNPGEVHDGRALHGRSRSWRLLYLDPNLMAEASADILEGGHGFFTFSAPVFADDQVRRLFDAAFAYSDVAAARTGTMACETALVMLLARLHRHSTAAPRNRNAPAPCIRRACRRIDDDPAAKLTLVELANEAGLSRYQLIRVFARELGLTPHAYILQRRIALARRLIRAGYDLAEVALAAGFCDQSHLTRCFVKQVGVSPRRYVSRCE